MQKRKRLGANIDIFELISKYRDHECLWNMNNKDYKNKAARQKVWERIAKHFGNEVSVVKNKVRLLRTAYVSEKKKVDKSKKTGGPVHTPMLFYYKYLTFLDNVVICRKGLDDIEFDKSNDFETSNDMERTNDWECEEVEVDQVCDDSNTFENCNRTEDANLDRPKDLKYIQESEENFPPAGYGGTIDVYELIAKYKDCECLWNYYNKDYKFRSKREKAWKNIAKYFGRDVSVVKNKLRGLRSAYVAEKRKIATSKKSSPTLFYFNNFSFLDDVVVGRSGADELESSRNNGFELTNDRTNDSIYDNNENSDDYDDKFEFQHNIIKEDTEEEPSPMSSPEPSYSSPQRHKLSAPKILTTSSHRSGYIEEQYSRELALQNAVKTVNTLTHKSKVNNLYTSFGTTIALQLQTMPLEVATITMSEIHTLLTRKLINFFQSKCSDKQFDENILETAKNYENT